jgi:hypothetical protein
MVDVHAKAALTEPVRHQAGSSRIWGESGHGKARSRCQAVSVDGVQVRGGPLSGVAQSLTELLNSVFNRAVMSFNAQPALAKARADALVRAQHSQTFDSCGKEEIAQQLAASVS